MMATGLRDPTLRPPEELETPRCPVTPLPERLVRLALGMMSGLDKQPELVGVSRIAGGHGWLVVLGCQAGARP